MPIHMILESNPSHKNGAEGYVEQPFIGYGENDEDWRKCEEYNDETVKVVIYRL